MATKPCHTCRMHARVHPLSIVAHSLARRPPRSHQLQRIRLGFVDPSIRSNPIAVPTVKRIPPPLPPPPPPPPRRPTIMAPAITQIPITAATITTRTTIITKAEPVTKPVAKPVAKTDGDSSMYTGYLAEEGTENVYAVAMSAEGPEGTVWRFPCVKCRGLIEMKESELNCRIFRHGSISPHADRATCDNFAQNSTHILGYAGGCGQPMQFDNGIVHPCGYEK